MRSCTGITNRVTSHQSVSPTDGLDALVLALAVEGPVLVEVASGVQSAELENGSAPASPHMAPVTADTCRRSLRCHRRGLLRVLRGPGNPQIKEQMMNFARWIAAGVLAGVSTHRASRRRSAAFLDHANAPVINSPPAR
jgi:hypothetical protein